MEGDDLQTIEMRSAGKHWAVEPAHQLSDSNQRDAADMHRMGKAQEFRVSLSAIARQIKAHWI